MFIETDAHSFVEVVLFLEQLFWVVHRAKLLIHFDEFSVDLLANSRWRFFFLQLSQPSLQTRLAFLLSPLALLHLLAPVFFDVFFNESDLVTTIDEVSLRKCLHSLCTDIT